MDFMDGTIETKTLEISEITSGNFNNQEVKINGAIHAIRDMADVSFVILRKREGTFQLVIEKHKELKVSYREFDASEAGASSEDFVTVLSDEKVHLEDGMTVVATGVLETNPKAVNGVEMHVSELEILSSPSEKLPLDVSKWKLKTSLNAKLDYRPISLRNIHERAKFRIQAGISRAFREYLEKNQFTEVHTPKLGAKSAEGGANLFKLEYFHKPAILQQSPQFYKQMMVGVFDRVYEVGPVFRAEKHNTKRHLNEYTSLDFEMGYIDSFHDIMNMETGFIKHMFEVLKKNYSKELQILGVKLEVPEKIPAMRFDEAKKKAAEKYGYDIKNPFDLEPEEEHHIGLYAKEEFGSDFLFITHYPSKKRPFYAMDDPTDSKYTLSFDLLYKGLEITTGGQRIHDYDMLMKKADRMGISSEGMEEYLSAFKGGMPPHGGLGIGLERLTMQIVGEDNIRETTLFPRDLSRL